MSPQTQDDDAVELAADPPAHRATSRTASRGAEATDDGTGVTPQRLRADTAAERQARYEAVTAAPGGPLALCRRYAVGALSREELVQHLAAYPYVEVERDPYDDFSPQAPGGWWEVVDAELLGLIDMDLYGEVFHLRHPGPWSPRG